jgi:hypothetical protein
VEPEVFVFDSSALAPTAATLRDRLEDRPSVTCIDVSAGSGARRDGTLAIKEAVRIGRPPDALYDGGLDPAPGALVMVEDTGRKSLYVGEDAIEALDDQEIG